MSFRKMNISSPTEMGRGGFDKLCRCSRLLLMFPCLILFALLVAGPVLAQTGGQPPLLDRELFFGDPEISGAQLSPDGQFIAFIKPHNKTRNIWVKRTSDPFTQAKLITNDT